MSRSPFRTSIWRRRDDAPFVPYHGQDETPDPVCIPVPHCRTCERVLDGDHTTDMDVDGVPVDVYFCRFCGSSVEVDYV